MEHEKQRLSFQRHCTHFCKVFVLNCFKTYEDQFSNLVSVEEMNHLRCRDFYAVGSALIDKNEKLHGFPV